MQKCYAERPDIKWAELEEICGKNRYPGPMGCTNPMRPCGLYETMISRVCPYTLAGFIYYQGESDDHRPHAYYTLMSALIRNWRIDWCDEELPFLLVQLPMFKYAEDPDRDNWAVIRQAQMRVFQTVRNTGIAVALDCGEFNNIHPTDKQPVGHRLFLQAMSGVYGGMSRRETLPPLFREFVQSASEVRLYFANCEGFEVRGDLRGFEVRVGGEWSPAAARIDGDTIVLTADGAVSAVRYKWTNYAEVELFGVNGLPVPTFSSDITGAAQCFAATEIRVTDGR
jgi:sialate O-acetylesterase